MFTTVEIESADVLAADPASEEEDDAAPAIDEITVDEDE